MSNFYNRSGFTDGFPQHFKGTNFSFEAKNLLSALKNLWVVEAKLKNPGEFWLIYHLSFPQRNSVNDGILPEDTGVHYATIEGAIQLTKKIGPGCFWPKTNIRNAFRIIPIRVEDYPLLGMKWKDDCYYDRCMPMGCSSSCKTFETLRSAQRSSGLPRLSLVFLVFFIYWIIFSLLHLVISLVQIS